MCYFVILACTPEAFDYARALMRSAFGLRETTNASVREMVPDGWLTFALTDGVCG